MVFFLLKIDMYSTLSYCIRQVIDFRHLYFILKLVFKEKKNLLFEILILKQLFFSPMNLDFNSSVHSKYNKTDFCCCFLLMLLNLNIFFFCNASYLHRPKVTKKDFFVYVITIFQYYLYNVFTKWLNVRKIIIIDETTNFPYEVTTAP